ncbi:major facilitator superfamily domain-containing protein [Infundibulicybe gibba]|nr:major facilitator superfamily domain-containing protein [Infundibulicybe gibba]
MNDNHIINEETALLAPAKTQQNPTPLPKVQISIALLLQLCELIASLSIYPYINQLISELDITGGDERKVGYYAGLIQSLFYLTEAVMVMQWSRISDHIGRKPVILLGLAGVMRSLMWELTNSSNRAQGFSLIPIVWAAGATLGWYIARPHERFPQVFGGKFWQEYPYFYLVSLHPASFVSPSSRSPVASGGVTPVDALPVRSRNEPLPLHNLLVYPVIISISNYMALAFLEIMLYALFPLFFTMPIHIGGLGFKPSTIGYIMGVYGVVMSSIAQRSGVNLVVWLGIAVLLSLMGFMEMAYGCISMYVMASSPNKRSLGATNGLAQMGTSLTRAIGPALATSLFSLSVEKNVLGGYAVYAVLCCISCLAAFLAMFLPEKVWEEKDNVEPGD